MTKGISEVQALRAIIGRMEVEVRTAQALLAMVILAQGGSVEVDKRYFDELPDDFEVKLTRDDDKATFTVIYGEEAEQFRRDNPIVVPT